MKQEFVLTHGYAALQETEKLDRSSKEQHLSVLCFNKNVLKKRTFCGHNIVTDSLFVTQLSNNAENSVWRIVCYDKLTFHEHYVIF